MTKLFLFLALFGFFAAQSASPQTSGKQNVSKIDQIIQTGFDALQTRKWSEAIKAFEDAQKMLEKEKQPSKMLFTLIELPDEDNSVKPSNEQERQILNYRHVVGTRQALLQFLAFAHQLNGNSAEAQKYQTAVYNLQGPLWGASWRLFIPRFYKVFNDLVKNEKGDNFGRYQYLAASLILDAGGSLPTIFEMLRTAQQNAPKDADVAGLLANAYLQKKNPQEAKKQAELSLSLKPDQKSVLIDLATAEWLLGDFDNSIKHAEAAARIDARLPGPRLTLALNYIEKKDFPQALKEAATAVELSNGHPYYLTVQAAVFEASGNAKEAEKILRKAWGGNFPTYEDLDTWYINETLRQLVLKIVKRIEKPEVST